MKKLSMVMLAALIAVAIVSSIHAKPAPKPAEIPLSWELKFDYQAPQTIEVLLPGETTPRIYWYMLYTVTNLDTDMSGTPIDHDFIPEFTLYTDTGELMLSGKGVSSSVFNAIKVRHNNPLLKRRTQVSGKLLYGRDNAIDAVAIWPDFDPNSYEFDIFIAGISGESAKMQIPTPITVTDIDPFGQEKTVKLSNVVLAKTLKLTWQTKGEAAARTKMRAAKKGISWVMR